VSQLTADVIGLCGSAIFVGAFAYANMAKVMDKALFNALNLAGAVMLLISLSVNFNLAATVLEIAWGCVALIGMIIAIRAKQRS
jgi:hypothetical protein